MSFNYNKNRSAEEHGNFWTSYSDLFMGLSVIFLLLYVTASLHSGTTGIQQQVKIQNLSLQVSDLKNQLKAYDNIRKEYLQKEATPDDQKVYSELMDKLTLLQEKARDEKNQLQKSAQENDQKEKALNQYQQMVRNIINANTLAKTKIKKRDVIIGDQDVEIADQTTEIQTLENQVKQREQQVAQGQQQIEQTKSELQQKISQLNDAYKQHQMNKQSYEKQVAQIKSANEAKLNELESENEKFQNDLSSAKQKLGDVNQKLGKVEAEKDSLAHQANELEGKVGSLSGQLKGAESELAKARAEADARRGVAKEISKEFQKAGVKADIDMQTGEVVIDFGDAYFESDSSKVKNRMAEILQKAVPAYARSLMENKKVSNAISNVEIIGFASPTYQGRVVDPNSLKKEDRDAFNYNMDLSYRRAKSIMQYIFDPNNMQFSHQKDILPLVKVSGRSFLEEAKGKRAVANSEELCRKYDCKKAQRVIIRFSMDGKQK